MRRDFRLTALKGLDAPIEAMRAASRAVKRPTGGWLRAVREAFGLTSAAAASKIGISRQAYSQVEVRESRGTVTLENLGRAATALNCDLVYFLLPRTVAGETFAALAARNDPEAKHLRDSERSMTLEGQQSMDEVDSKNIGLAKQIYWLRQNLSLYELVTVNAGKLKEAGLSDALFGHIQQLALQAIAVTLCKLYERETRADLNSIDGVINSLPEYTHTDAQRRSAERFAERHGILRPCENPRDYLRTALATFRESNAATFSSLRLFRDKYAAHSEHGFALESLPSFEDFEELYAFAYGFYFLVSDSFLGVGPALMTLHVGTGFVRLLKQLHIEHPTPGFPVKRDA
jgi:predicted DNA-binding mobile mystery protein A